MFERYTESARRVIFFARYEASGFGSTTIEAEHLLLGLMREDKDLFNVRLRNSVESIRAEIEGRTPRQTKTSTSTDLPLSNQCKRILGYAGEEASQLNHRNIGTEHLLLAILREEKCVAAEILFSRGLRFEAIREELANNAPRQESRSGFPIESVNAELLNLSGVFRFLETHRFTASKQHLERTMAAGLHEDLKSAQVQLQLFIETLVDAIRERLKGDDVASPIFEGFDWRLSLRGFRSGLSEAEDWNLRWRLTMLLAEVLLKRFEQRLT